MTTSSASLLALEDSNGRSTHGLRWHRFQPLPSLMPRALAPQLHAEGSVPPGLAADQARVLAEVLGGRTSILPHQPQRCTLGELLSFCRFNVASGPVWEQMAALVDTATRMVANFRGLQQPPPLQQLVHSHIGALLRKPVRARCARQVAAWETHALRPEISLTSALLGHWATCTFPQWRRLVSAAYH